MKLCTVPDCDREDDSAGLCSAHRSRLDRGDLRADVPIATAVIGWRGGGCDYCGAGTYVRGALCQAWCARQTYPAKEVGP